MKMNQDGSGNFKVDNHQGAASGFIGGFSAAVLKVKWLLLLLSIALAAFSIPGLFKLDITVDIEEFFLKDDPVIKNQQKFRELFQGNDFVGVLHETDDVFSRESLELIKRVSDRLMEDVPLGRKVISLVDSGMPSMNGARLKFDRGILKSPDYILKRFKEECVKNSSLKGVFFSDDHREAWIQLQLSPYPPDNEWTGELKPMFAVGKAGYETVSSIESGNARLTATGLPVYTYRKEAEMMQDLVKILIIGAIVALLLTVVIFRNIQGIVGTFLVAGISIVSVLGIQGWMGISIDSAFIAVPILLAIGVAIGYTVHISRFFRVHFRNSGSRYNAVRFAMGISSRPILFTAFTTIAALLSFMFVDIKPIRWVGLTSALCILAVYLFSITLFPVVLSLGRNDPGAAEAETKSDRMEILLRVFARWLTDYTALIVIIFISVSALCIYGITKLEVDFHAEKMMGTRLPHMKDQSRIIHSSIATSEMVDLVLVLPPAGFREPAVLKKLEKLESEISSLPLVKKTGSLAGSVRYINYLMHGSMRAFDTVPENKNMLRMFTDLAEKHFPDYLSAWVTEDYSTIRIFIQISQFSSLEIENDMKKIDSLVAEYFPESREHFFSGSTYQMTVMNQYITRGLIQSVFTALVMITILMIIVFKSLRLGLIAMIPNVFPVIVAGGVMGFMQIPLEFVTMTVAPMILGLAVDDTIHLLVHLKEDMEKTGNFRESITLTFSVVGSAVTETSVILCLTFLVFIFSQVNSINNMGFLTCAGLFAAYMSDIFVTPILIKRFKYSGGETGRAE